MDYFSNSLPMAGLTNLAFREELHAIEAAISGQGIAICSDWWQRSLRVVRAWKSRSSRAAGLRLLSRVFTDTP
jgi:hypothetical protein